MVFAPEKSKILIVHQKSLDKSARNPSFFLNHEKLEIVPTFNYLGIEISRKGDVGDSCPRPYSDFFFQNPQEI